MRADAMANKVMTIEDILCQVRSGDTIVLGGGGLQRKPMAFVRALVKSDVADLHVVTFQGGPDVDMLVGAGKVRRVTYAYVGFDAYGLAPNFRRARSEGSIEACEGSEYMLIAALDAAAKGVPFLPVRSGLGSDLLKYNPDYRIICDPFSEEKVVAVKAIRPDVAFIHVNYADSSGYGQILGDVFIDDICARASSKVFLSAERIIPTEYVQKNPHNTAILRIWVDGVAEARFGAHFTSCFPFYRTDASHVRVYTKYAASQEAFGEYLRQHVKNKGDHLEYVNAQQSLAQIVLSDPSP
jgi:glutaconate CoA-transferase subunit A